MEIKSSRRVVSIVLALSLMVLGPALGAFAAPAVEPSPVATILADWVAAVEHLLGIEGDPGGGTGGTESQPENGSGSLDPDS